jgi:hypothetical protein
METVRPSREASCGARKPPGSKLMIVQTHQLAASSLGRYLGQYFDVVRVARSRGEAEKLFREGSPFTHLVCGDDLGAHEPRGCELIVSWRRLYPGIARAVLATGAEPHWHRSSTGNVTPGVDAVFKKPDEPGRLLNLLGVVG